jgi:hypothetical protein
MGRGGEERTGGSGCSVQMCATVGGGCESAVEPCAAGLGDIQGTRPQEA